MRNTAVRDAANYAIDLVIPHVDGDAPGFAAAHQHHLGRPPVPCQLRDSGELRFVLRSIARFAGFFRHIYLAVMDEGHAPDWLDRRHIKVVTHDQFMPAELLPTFHFAPIWYYLHNIDGLSERFVIAADDELFGRPVYPADFFDREGIPRTDVYTAPVPGHGPAPKSTYGVKLRTTRRVLFEGVAASANEQRFGHFVFPHIARGGTVSSWREMLAAFAHHEDVQATLARKNRAGVDDADRYVLTDQLYVGWVEQRLRKRAWWQKWLWMSRLHVQSGLAQMDVGVLPSAIYKMTNDPERTRGQMRRLLRQRPARFCINDDAYDTFGTWQPQWRVNPESLAAVHEALTTMFPEPSPYECDLRARSAADAAKPSAAT